MAVSFCLESVTIVGTLWNDLRFEALVVATVEEAEAEEAAAAKVEVEAPWSIDRYFMSIYCHHSTINPKSPGAVGCRDPRRKSIGGCVRMDGQRHVRHCP
jgi:hypothetical protein